MMLILRAWRVFFLVAVAILATANGAHAKIKTKAKYAILLDVETNTILYEKNADTLMEPASMSKLMTLVMVFRELKAGRITMERTYRVSEYAWRTGGAPSRTAAMFAPLNKMIRVDDLLRGAIIQSGNDACIILAEGLAGSEDSFAKLMTDFARKIGLEKSTFGNSTGLPNPKQKMTARELAKLALYIIKNYPEYYPIFAEREFHYRRHRFYNRNPLLSAAGLGADGLKTGHTEESGYGLVGSAVQNGRRLIVVVNGLESAKERKTEASRLLNWGFRNFEKFTLFDAGETVGKVQVWGGEKGYLKLRGLGEEPVRVLLPKNARFKKLKGRIVYQGPVKPPIAPGDSGEKIGTPVLHVSVEGGISATAPLEAAESVKKAGLVKQGWDSLFYLAFGWWIHYKG
jgi:D-alanyl-D-alanine carboxypeptidase (penicillin-binding protein 5/6)